MTWSEIRDFVYQAIGWVVSYSRVAKSSADGNNDEVEGRAAPNEPSYQIPVRRMWPFGFRSRPPAAVEAVVVMVNGGASKGVMVGAESAKYGPSNLDEGESALYCIVADCVVKLDKNGSVTITATNGAQIVVNQDGSITHDSASGKDVIVNGGSAKVHRVGDHGDAGTLKFATVANGVCSGTYTDPDGTPHPFTLGADIALKSKATEGAQHFKG